jgi:hypothetical protein
MRIGIKIFILVFCTSAVLAQPKIHLGITTAVNSTFVLDKGLSEDPRYSSTANFEWAPVGVNFGVDFTKRIGLQLESIKAAQGQIYQMIETAQAAQTMIAERSIDLSYLQFPLLLKMMNGGNKAARFNFQVGPQLSILSGGSETINFIKDASVNLAQGGDINLEDAMVLIQSEQDIPIEYQQMYQDALANGAIAPPDGIGGVEVPIEYFQNGNPGEYNMPENSMMTLMSSEVESKIQSFKDKEIQLAFGFGMDIDVWKNFYISANVRANYSFTDMRNEDLINMIGDNDLTSIFSNRANLLVGAQFGLHWVIGGNRSSRAKAKEEKKALEVDDDPFK